MQAGKFTEKLPDVSVRVRHYKEKEESSYQTAKLAELLGKKKVVVFHRGARDGEFKTPATNSDNLGAIGCTKETQVLLQHREELEKRGVTLIFVNQWEEKQQEQAVAVKGFKNIIYVSDPKCEFAAKCGVEICDDKTNGIRHPLRTTLVYEDGNLMKSFVAKRPEAIQADAQANINEGISCAEDNAIEILKFFGIEQQKTAVAASTNNSGAGNSLSGVADAVRQVAAPAKVAGTGKPEALVVPAQPKKLVV